MAAITLHVNHLYPTNKRKSDLIKAATQLLKDIISQESQTELIIVENESTNLKKKLSK
jgi:hypothetical protein